MNAVVGNAGSRALPGEGTVCMRLNRLADRQWIGRGFAIVSRLGDGVFWYALMALLPMVAGRAGLMTSIRMAVVGALSWMIYRAVKQSTRRLRPFAADTRILARVAPLDEFSFPSGHTLHAVAFTLVATQQFPTLGWLLWPFAVLVALSRVVLGLHYPSDVLASVLIAIGLVAAVGGLLP